jgi:polyisoprenoid-binding protein YceI
MRMLIFICAMSVVFLANAQRYKSVSSNVKFYSKAPLEDIEAVNVHASSIVDLGAGTGVFSVPIKKFEFEKKLMQEHFNENYLESDKYPNGIFSCTFEPKQLQAGLNTVRASGEMTIHGVKQNIHVTGKMFLEDNKLKVDAEFPINLADYKIKIPKAVFYNIAETVLVTVTFTYEAN